MEQIKLIQSCKRNVNPGKGYVPKSNSKFLHKNFKGQECFYFYLRKINNCKANYYRKQNNPSQFKDKKNFHDKKQTKEIHFHWTISTEDSGKSHETDEKMFSKILWGSGKKIN